MISSESEARPGLSTRLVGHTREDLRTLITDLGHPSYRADQLAQWLYEAKADSLDEMTNLPKALRAELVARFSIGRYAPSAVSVSDDGTKKYLYGAPVQGRDDSVSPQRLVEAAYIPDGDRATLCLSTQIGCSMGCLFCMTARQGFQGNLSCGEIVNQYLSLPERDDVTNIVYMGMGEPLDNVDEVLRSLEIFTAEWGLGLSQKRITVSTIGVIPGLRRFLAESGCHLAVSLHSPFDDERRKLMPVQHVHPIADVLGVIREASIGKQRRVSFEYIVFSGLNHSAGHAKEIAKLLHGVSARVNLIRFHQLPGSPLRTASREEMVDFQNALKAKGIPTTIRTSRGEDVQAACGLLSTKALIKRPEPDY